MQFNARVVSMTWSDPERLWSVTLQSGETLRTRFVITGIGVLSVPTLPHIEGMDCFKCESFHTYWWPKEPIYLNNKRVGIIGTGPTGIQIIAEIADKAGELTVFQRRPNWSVPLNNSPISEQEMTEIRSRYERYFCNL
jgi:cation diffusion facilitator CzcD-associated flavoprotein CzcO